MKRLLQSPIGWLLPGVAGMLALSFLCLTSQPGDAVDTKPGKPPADFKAYKEAIPGSEVSFEMLPIPPNGETTTFVMGSPAAEKGRADDEGPQHPVEIRPFWIEKTEVTWDEYELFRLKNDNIDAVSRPTKPYVDPTFGHGRETYPVICITHHSAMEYCRWLSIKTGKTYRLPTEAEWEYACRAGTKTAYSFGNDLKQLDDYAWHAGNSDEKTQPVGQKKPNPWGLHDMHGNVAEWCLDHYKIDSYAGFPTDKPTLQPVLLPTEKRFSHVARGGSWADKADRLRSAARIGSELSWMKQDPQRPRSIWWLTDAEFVGFRVVRPVEEQENLKGLQSKVTRQSD